MASNFKLTASFEVFDKVTAPIKKITKSVSALGNKLRTTNTAINNTLKRTSRRFSDLRNRVIDYASGLDKGERFSTRFANAAKQLNTTQKNFKKILRDNNIELRGMGKGLEQASIKAFDLGRKLTLLVTLPTLAFARSTIKTVAAFQTSMNIVEAKTEATKEQMQELTATARDLGATTKFTAAEVATGMAKLAEAGEKPVGILKAIPNILALAAAGQLSMAEAADIATSATAGFRLKIEEVSNVADMLTNAANNSKTNIAEMGRAFSFTARTASNAGFSISETLAILGQFSAASIRSGRAGRAFVAMLSSIQKADPTKGLFGTIAKRFNIEVRDPITGNLKKAKDILNEFTKIQREVGTEKASAILFKLFGRRVAPVLSLLSGKKMTEAVKLIERTGAASKNTAIQMQGLPGVLKLLQSAYEELQITIFEGPFGKGITSVLKNLTAFFRILSTRHPIVVSVASSIAMLTAALGPLLIIIGTLGTAFKTVVGSTALLAIFKFTGVIGLAVVLIGTMVSSWKELGTVMKAVLGIGTALALIFATVPTLIGGALVGLATMIPKINRELEKGTSIFDIFKKGIIELAHFMGNVGIIVSEEIKRVLSNVLKNIVDLVSGGTKRIVPIISNVFKSITDAVSEYIEDKFTAIKTKIADIIVDIKNKINAILRPLGLMPFTPTIGGIPQRPPFIPSTVPTITGTNIPSSLPTKTSTVGGSANITLKIESEDGIKPKISAITNNLTGATIAIDSGFMGKPVGAF